MQEEGNPLLGLETTQLRKGLLLCVFIPAQPPPLFSLCVCERVLLHKVAHVKWERPGALCVHTNKQSKLSGTARPLEGPSEHPEQMQPNPAC